MRRIVKVGGSLLTRSTLVPDVNAWLARQTPAQTLIIFGGGELIDCIRRLDGLRPGEPVEVHWRCVDLLQTTFQMASDWFGSWDKIDSPAGLKSALDAVGHHQGPLLVSVRTFYHPQSRHALPLDWSTTTDSIAAAFAIETDADELVILKSCDVDTEADAQTLAQQGIVDLAFPKAASRVNSIRIEKLPQSSPS